MKKNSTFLFILFTVVFIDGGFAKSTGPEENMDISPSCDRDFVNSYIAKKDCLINNHGDQCIRWALYTKVGVAATGGGAGAFVGNFLESSLESNPTFKAKFLDVINEIRSSYKDFKTAAKLMENFEDEATKKLSQGKYQKFEDIRKQAALSRRRTFTDEELKLQHEAYELGHENFRKATMVEKDLNLRNAMEGMLKSGNIETTSKTRVLKKISEVFPEEYKKLQPYFEEQQKIYQEYSKSLRERPNDKSILKRNELADKLSKEKLNAILKSSSKQTRLVAELMEKGWSTSYSSSLRKPVFNSAREIISKENLTAAFTKAKTFVKNAGSGIAVAIGLDSAASYAKYQHLTFYLNSCKSELGLSDKEVSFMSDYHLVSDQNIIYQGTERAVLDCKKFSFNSSEDSINDAFEKFGGIPKGICGMMTKESKNLDGLIREKESKISCTQNRYLETLSNGKIFGNVDMFRGGGAVAPYDKDIQWPYTQYFSHNKGFEDFNKSSPCMISPDFGEDQNRECIKMQIVSCYGTSSKRCDVVEEASKARVGATMASILCPTQETSAKTQIPASK